MASLSTVVPSAPRTGNRPLAKAAPTCTERMAPSRPRMGKAPTAGTELTAGDDMHSSPLPVPPGVTGRQGLVRSAPPVVRQRETVGWDKGWLPDTWATRFLLACRRTPASH